MRADGRRQASPTSALASLVVAGARMRRSTICSTESSGCLPRCDGLTDDRRYAAGSGGWHRSRHVEPRQEHLVSDARLSYPSRTRLIAADSEARRRTGPQGAGRDPSWPAPMHASQHWRSSADAFRRSDRLPARRRSGALRARAAPAYLCLSHRQPSSGRRMIGIVDHAPGHFVDPVVLRDGRHQVPNAPDLSSEIARATLERCAYPDCAEWAP